MPMGGIEGRVCLSQIRPEAFHEFKFLRVGKSR